jgi:Domain of unknown function (DUF4145)
VDNLKEITITKQGTHYFSNLKISIPRFCPHCSQAISAITQEFLKVKHTRDHFLNIFQHACPDCNKSFITIHLREVNETKQGSTLEFVSIYPNNKKITFHRLIEEVSPRFVDVYNQAYTSEQQKHIEVAGIGYRLSLEILIKDFAIKSLNKDAKEVIDKSLSKALKEYVDDQETLTSADVVRHLGNDYAHYNKEFEEVEFAQLKWYLDMFIKKIETKLLFLNPPVPTRVVTNNF